MTSAPVSVSSNAYFAGQMTTAASVGTDVETSFSDVLKNQKSEGEVKSPEKLSQPKKEVKTDEVSEPAKKEVSVKETEDREVMETEGKDAEDAVAAEMEEAAEKMVEEVAEELGMTEEEVLEVLNSLNMVPADLLNVENLQAVILEVTGEGDLSSFVTNEELFTSLKNLTQSLEEVIGEISEKTGVSETEVKEIFSELLNGKAEGNATLETEEIPQTGIAEEGVDVAEETKVNTDDESKATTGTSEDGADVMLERSLETAQSGNAAMESNAQNASENPFNPNGQAQTVQTDMAQSMQAVEAPQSYFSEDTMRIMNQITDYMRGQVTDGVSELEMQLNPESLGTLHIKLTAKEGVLTAQFTAQNDIVKNVLESQMIQLKENFKEQGVTVEAIEVTVESHKFDENFNQEHGESMQEQSRNFARSQTRRINLDSLDFEEENLTEEEQLAAEMLRENGGTVDYTA